MRGFFLIKFAYWCIHNTLFLSISYCQLLCSHSIYWCWLQKLKTWRKYLLHYMRSEGNSLKYSQPWTSQSISIFQSDLYVHIHILQHLKQMIKDFANCTYIREELKINNYTTILAIGLWAKHLSGFALTPAKLWKVFRYFHWIKRQC